MSNLQAHYLVHSQYNISSGDAIAEEKPGKWWDIDAITHHLISRRSNDCMCIRGGHIEAKKEKWLPFLDYIFFYEKRYNLSHISQNFVPNGWNSGKSLEVQRR